MKCSTHTYTLNIYSDMSLSETTLSALNYVCDMAQKCQHRGGYTLDDAVKLHKSIENIRTHSEQQDFTWDIVLKDKTHDMHVNVLYVFDMLEKSQCRGVLNLEEAWTIYNALLLLFTKNNTNAIPKHGNEKD